MKDIERRLEDIYDKEEHKEGEDETVASFLAKEYERALSEEEGRFSGGARSRKDAEDALWWLNSYLGVSIGDEMGRLKMGEETEMTCAQAHQ